MTLRKANEHRNAWFEGVQKCHLDETLFTVMERIVRAEVHRLVVVNENEKVIGIISLSDILLYLVLKPSGDGIGGNEQSLRASDPVIMKKSNSNSGAEDEDKISNSRSIDNIKEEELCGEVTEGNASIVDESIKEDKVEESESPVHVNGNKDEEDSSKDDVLKQNVDANLRSDSRGIVNE